VGRRHLETLNAISSRLADRAAVPVGRPPCPIGGPRTLQIYGGYTFLSNTINGVPGSRQPLNGWDAAVAFPAWHNLRFKIDTYAYRGTNLGAPQHPFFIMGGGQYTWRVRRESVFVEGLLERPA